MFFLLNNYCMSTYQGFYVNASWAIVVLTYCLYNAPSLSALRTWSRLLSIAFYIRHSFLFNILFLLDYSTTYFFILSCLSIKIWLRHGSPDHAEFKYFYFSFLSQRIVFESLSYFFNMLFLTQKLLFVILKNAQFFLVFSWQVLF